jgi:subtilisin family serine protease
MTLHSPSFGRTPAALAAVALVLLLSACGGADEAPPAADIVAAPSATLEDRRFTLWAPEDEAALRAEQRQLDPATDGSTVQLIVRLNPAAVFAPERQALLGHTGNGESGDAAALRASQLAAKASAVASAAQAVLARSVVQAAPGAVVRQQFSHAVEAFVLAVPWDQADAVAAELARNPAVDAVEPDRRFTIGQATPPVRALDARAWGVDRIDQRSRVFDSSFRHTRNGSGTTVYVVDTGVNPHNEFGNRLVSGYSAINDGRGTADCQGHGTHVAGTAAGATLGVAPGARVVPVRVLDCSGSSSGSSVLQGLDWVAANGTRPGVVNMSLGGSASSTVDAAAQRLVTAGFSVVAAAGNSNIDACTQSPGRAAGLVTVAASDRNDVKASFSNWGSCVALWAPGTGIASAGHSSATAVAVMNGTSMAAPHAAGAVALLLQAQPTWAPAQVRQQLLAQASPNAVAGAPGSMSRSLLYAGEDGAVTTAPTPTPLPTPAPSIPTVSVRGITMTTQVPAVGSWKALAEVAVVDAAGRGVAGAQVTGRYSNSSKDISCTTAASGLCTLASANASWATVPVLGMAITAVKGTNLAYTGGGARNAQIARPAAPQASVAGLVGTMVRAKPTAVEWTPQFVVTMKDERGNLVVNATVRAAMQAHVGASVAAARTLSCRTGTAGTCTLVWNGTKLNATHTGAAVQVLDAQRDFLVYRPGAVSSASVGRIR